MRGNRYPYINRAPITLVTSALDYTGSEALSKYPRLRAYTEEILYTNHNKAGALARHHPEPCITCPVLGAT